MTSKDSEREMTAMIAAKFVMAFLKATGRVPTSAETARFADIAASAIYRLNQDGLPTRRIQ